MSQSTATRLSLDEVRASVKRMQAQGEKMVVQLRKDASAIVARAQVVSLEDARHRATQAVRNLDAQGTKLGKILLEQLESLVTAARTMLGAASAADLTALTRRVSHLEHHPAEAKEIARLLERVAQLERRIESLTKAA